MLNVPQFQRAAKDFRAGKLDILQFTRLVYEASTADHALAPPSDQTGNTRSPREPGAPVDSLGPAQANTPHSRPVGDVVSPSESRPVDRLNLDMARAARCGFSEVIFSPGKTLADLTNAAQRLLSERQSVLMTRIADDEAIALQHQFASAIHNPLARTLRISAVERQASPAATHSRPVAVLTAGTGDIPIAEEACETLRWMGLEPKQVYDVGVAGPQRLLPHVPFLQTCAAIVVVAGMEGALPSVVGGHVACPVIAVPTSLGYGAHFQGLVPLLGMINSCAANVVAVNIDAGFKGGYLAGLIVTREHASVSSRSITD
jgi:pyridinium-3,5-biscarboxylic acid mononucleotide synthase